MRRESIALLITVVGFAPGLLPPAIAGILAIPLLVPPVEAVAVGGIAVSETAMPARVERIIIAGIIRPFLEPVAKASLLFGGVIPAGIAVAAIAPVGKVPAISVLIVSVPVPLARAFYRAGTLDRARSLDGACALYRPATIPLTVTIAVPISVPVSIASVVPTPVPAAILSVG